MMASAATQDRTTLTDELLARIDQLDRDARLLSIGELRRRADAIRNIAAAARLPLPGRLAAALRDALARDGRAVPVAEWTRALRGSIDHAAQDEATATRLLAALGVRPAG